MLSCIIHNKCTFGPVHNRSVRAKRPRMVTEASKASRYSSLSERRNTLYPYQCNNSADNELVLLYNRTTRHRSSSLCRERGYSPRSVVVDSIKLPYALQRAPARSGLVRSVFFNETRTNGADRRSPFHRMNRSVLDKNRILRRPDHRGRKLAAMIKLASHFRYFCTARRTRNRSSRSR